METVNKYLPKLGLLRLKDLIKAIRACKTAADERAVIARESAVIRTAFKEEQVETRHINVAKLLYIHMLGYPAHFGQIECLKLVASPKFTDKRLGYLGIMLLLDEKVEVLTLVTNCLKNDMNSSNIYVVGLALCTLGDISSAEMARDLSGEIERLLGSTNAYVRKKAALCALRILRKVPDLLEHFVDRAMGLVNERNHGVLLTGITLLTEMTQLSTDVLEKMRTIVPTLIRHLENLLTYGFSPEHDVGSITDPFLQVGILRLLRVLGHQHPATAEAMTNVLTQVATVTDSSKNVGSAIMYETVLTILETPSESSLRVMAINNLGKFLSNRDNNIRYVALTTLTRTQSAMQSGMSGAGESASSDASELQRYRGTIIECLHDLDISIRRRALDLSFFLITPANIRLLTRELLSFLEVCEPETKPGVANRICEVAGNFRPNARWELDTIMRILRVAGQYVDQAVVNHLVKLVSAAAPALQQYASRKLFYAVQSDQPRIFAQEGLVLAMMWCVGEWGDLVTGPNVGPGIAGDDDDDEDATTGPNGAVRAPAAAADAAPHSKPKQPGHDLDDLEALLGGTSLLASAPTKDAAGSQPAEDGRVSTMLTPQNAPSEEAVLALFEACLSQPRASLHVCDYATVALAKLASRFSADSSSFPTCSRLIRLHAASTNTALQQRVAEMSHLLRLDRTMLADLLEPLPALDASLREEQIKNEMAAAFANGASAAAVLAGGKGKVPAESTKPNAAHAKSAAQDDLMSLLFDTSTDGVVVAATAASKASTLPMGLGAPGASNLLGDLMDLQPVAASTSGVMGAPSTTAMAPTTAVPTGQNLLDGLFNTTAAPPTAPSGHGGPLHALDLGGDLLGCAPAAAAAAAPASMASSLSQLGSRPMTAPSAATPAAIEVYHRSGLRITLSASGPVAQSPRLRVTAQFSTTGPSGVSGLAFQVAVPRALTLTMHPASASALPPSGGRATQSFDLENPSAVPVRLRLKIAFTPDQGAPVDEIVDFAGFA